MGGGVLNTATPQKKLTNTASPQEKSTKHRHRKSKTHIFSKKKQTNCGYKHNKTTHAVKFYIYGLDVSYAGFVCSNIYLLK